MHLCLSNSSCVSLQYLEIRQYSCGIAPNTEQIILRLNCTTYSYTVPNTVQGKLYKQKWKVIDEQFLTIIDSQLYIHNQKSLRDITDRRLFVFHCSCIFRYDFFPLILHIIPNGLEYYFKVLIYGSNCFNIALTLLPGIILHNSVFICCFVEQLTKIDIISSRFSL